MKPDKNGTKPDDAGEGKTRKSLRRRAEERMSIKGGTEENPDHSEDLQKIIHELQVNKVELEIQNEELLRIRNELDAEVSRYSELYDFAPVGIFTLDKNSTIIEVNLNGAVMLGTNRSSLCGRRFLDFIAEEFRADFNDFMKGVFEKMGKERHDIECRLKSDSPIFVHMRANVKPAGENFLVAVTDITERKEAEEELKATNEELRREKELFKNTFESLEDAAFVLRDRPAIIRAVNEAAVRAFGYNREEMVGKNISMLHVDRKSLEKFDKIIYPYVKAHKKIPRFEFPMKRSDGTVFPTENSISNFFNYEKTSRSRVSIVRDITERKELEMRERESLKQIEVNLEQLAALNDEIRNPLTVITGLVELNCPECAEGIINQVNIIDDIITVLDAGWVRSEKIWEYLRAHYGVGEAGLSIEDKK